jgi:ribokinase
MTNILLPNRLGALELSKEENVNAAAKKLLQFGPEVVVITLGERGCLVVTENDQFRVPAFKIKVVDTTGAGDAFNAGFIVALHRKKKLKEAAQFANAVAALKCTKLGAQSSPTLKEVKAFLSRKPEKLL